MKVRGKSEKGSKRKMPIFLSLSLSLNLLSVEICSISVFMDFMPVFSQYKNLSELNLTEEKILPYPNGCRDFVCHCDSYTL